MTRRWLARFAAVLTLIGVGSLGCKSAGDKPAPVEPSVAAPTAPASDANVAAFDHVWETIRDKHWDAKLHGLDWQAVRDELRPRVAAAESVAEARAVIDEMLGRLGQSHFAVFPGAAYGALAKPGEAGKPSADGEAQPPAPDAGEPGTAALAIAIVAGQALVTRVFADSIAATGVAPGWQVTHIGDEEVGAIIAKVEEAFKESTMLAGMLTRALEGRLDGPLGSKIKVGFVDANGAAVERELVRVAPVGKLVEFGNMPPLYLRYESRRVVPEVGYIAFNMFFDPALVMASFGRDVTAFADSKGIIIDLRGNPGGIGGMAMGMGGWFVTEPNQALGTMTTRGASLRFVLNPRGAESYAGKVAVLIDGNSMSTSEIFAAGLKDLGRARLFGTRTGGAALPSAIERLVNGDGFQYAFANYVSANGAELEGKGVSPDVELELSRAALLAGRDPVIDAAVAWIVAD